MDVHRALLDELMGNDRDIHPSEKKRKNLRFDDPEICKNYLCGFCPHDLFTNTKSDLGPCPKIHDDTCKQEWQVYDKKHRYSFENEFFRTLERLIGELDRRIKRGHERLDHQDDEVTVSVPDENKDKIDTINQRCDQIVKEIEQLGEEGRIDDANTLMKTLEGLKQEKEILLRVPNMDVRERRMKVCETCGAFLVIGDTEKRTASHLDGKQHQGYRLIRETLKEHHKKREEDRKQRRDRDRRGSGERSQDRRSSKEREGTRRSPRLQKKRTSREDDRKSSNTREGDRSRRRSRSRDGKDSGREKKRHRRS